MASNLTPSKRPSDENPQEPEVPAKLQKTGPATSVRQRLVTYKVLCPVAMSGSVIGKGGNIVSKIRQDTGAKIKLEDAVGGCSERIVIITSVYKEAQKLDEGAEKDGTAENEEKEVGAEEPSEAVPVEKATPAAFTALMRVFERVMLEECDLESEGEGEGEGEAEARESEEEKEAERASLFVTFRMLVLSGQVGSLLGKGGVIIKKIMAESGAQVRVLSRDQLPICAKPQEDVVQVTGDLDSVRKAVMLIAKQLLERPPGRDRDPSKPGPTPSASSHPFAPKQFGVHPQFGGYPHESVTPGAPVDLMTYRMLCTNDQVGGVIGKAGYIVKNIKNETGSDITISELNSEAQSEDRLITIQGPVLSGQFHGDSFSPIQHAVLRVHHRLVLSSGVGAETREQQCRLVIASSQVGCLLGKGGSIMAEMRKSSGAFIRIMARGKDPIPDGIGQDEEAIQINGNGESVQEAIIQITSRLKQHFLRDKAPLMNHASPYGMEPPFGPYMGSGASPQQHLSSQPPPFHGYGRSYEEGPPYDRHAPRGTREPLPDYGSHPSRKAGTISPEEASPVIPSITLEVTIPRSLVPNLCGEDGGCLNKIREISEAKITITELRPESPETVIMVSGVPEHAYCAQSLLEAFVLSETPSSPDVGKEAVLTES
ncbi:hypothetical protein LUZ63_016416 [Rhynchospora breviuscula]|uniref:K Homology domain-containing protein n=1 Tax=Rhynchospora breviuscula TaxID=2022672 RepID=A0A9P9ZBI0_9POAL|nr:hypothetical protein LUZ63_016416 [Rhynchospora breviuscula]